MKSILLFTLIIAGCCLQAATHPICSVEQLHALIAQKAISPGDEIVWANGRYDDVVIDFTGIDGKPGSPVTLRAETPGMVIFGGASRVSIGADYGVLCGFHFKTICDASTPGKLIEFRGVNGDHARHSRVTQIAIEESKIGSPVLNRSKWIVLYGQFNRVDHCYFAGKRTHDNLVTVYLDESVAKLPAWHRIDHNYFGYREDGKLAGGTTNGWEIIRIGDSKTSLQKALCRVERNYFERCSGEIEIISNKSGNNTFLGNAFVECSGQLTLRHGFGCLVADNLFIGNLEDEAEESGVRIIGPDHQVVGNTFWRLDGQGVRGAIVLTEGVRDGRINEYAPVDNALVRANTIIDCRSPIVIGAMHGRKAKDGKLNDVPPMNVVIAENMVTGEAPVFEYLCEKKPGITIRNNIAYTNAMSVEIPWTQNAVEGFVVEPLLAAEVDDEAILQRVHAVKQMSGPEWWPR